MRVEKGKVRAPEIGRVWLNSTPLSFRQVRGRVVLVEDPSGGPVQRSPPDGITRSPRADLH